MAVEYLRGLCQNDGFARGEFHVFGKPVSLADVQVPLCAIACETDHIAHWRGSFNGVKQMGSPEKTFILSESAISPGSSTRPARTSMATTPTTAPDRHARGMEGRRDLPQGQLWPRWGAWLAERSGPRVPARHPATGLTPCSAPRPAPMWRPNRLPADKSRHPAPTPRPRRGARFPVRRTAARGGPPKAPSRGPIRAPGVNAATASVTCIRMSYPCHTRIMRRPYPRNPRLRFRVNAAFPVLCGPRPGTLLPGDRHNPRHAPTVMLHCRNTVDFLHCSMYILAHETGRPRNPRR